MKKQEKMSTQLPVSRGKTGKNNRRKGHAAETETARIFRDHTPYTSCCTTRNSSRLLDNCGIDLNFIPLNVQVKKGLMRGMDISGELRLIGEKMEKNLPSNHPRMIYPKVLIHHKEGKSGKKKTAYDTLVHMTLEDFIRLFQKAHTQPEPVY